MTADSWSLIGLTVGIILIAGSFPHISLHLIEMWKDLVS